MPTSKRLRLKYVFPVKRSHRIVLDPFPVIVHRVVSSQSNIPLNHINWSLDMYYINYRIIINILVYHFKYLIYL